MNTREYKNYKRMTKMTVRFLENHEKSPIFNLATTKIGTLEKEPLSLIKPELELTIPTKTKQTELFEKMQTLTTMKKETTPTLDTNTIKLDDNEMRSSYKEQQPENGRYTNWGSQHSALATQPWCCIGDLMAFCDKYEYRTLNRNDPQTHNRIVSEVKALLNGQAPFDTRKRFPGDIRSPENLWVCIGRCAGVEYHLNRIISVFRKPMDKLAAEKQRMVRHDFHLAINELRLDISARISEVRLYDRNVFEREFRLEWQDETPSTV